MGDLVTINMPSPSARHFMISSGIRNAELVRRLSRSTRASSACTRHTWKAIGRVTMVNTPPSPRKAAPPAEQLGRRMPQKASANSSATSCPAKCYAAKQPCRPPARSRRSWRSGCAKRDSEAPVRCLSGKKSGTVVAAHLWLNSIALDNAKPRTCQATENPVPYFQYEGWPSTRFRCTHCSVDSFRTMEGNLWSRLGLLLLTVVLEVPPRQVSPVKAIAFTPDPGLLLSIVPAARKTWW